MEVFDGLRTGLTTDMPQFWKDISAPFYGANRPGSKVSQGARDRFFHYALMVGLKPAYDCIKAFSETDFTEDLKKFDVPTLFIQGDDDQIVPFPDTSKVAVKLVKGAVLKVYPGAPHGLMTTNQQEFNADLLEFAKSGALKAAVAA
jgi:non-heme chloroperoxidase